MDSRIREIEQWIEQAKTGLHEGGREEYVKKLYLLDAEIRAVIKESGTIPGVNTSPERRGRGARRPTTHLVTAGALASILALAALTAWFANPVILSRRGAPETRVADLTGIDAALDASLAQHIPSAISGEELVVASWLDYDPLMLAAAGGTLAGTNDAPSSEAGAGAPVGDIGPALQQHNAAQPPVLLAGGGQTGNPAGVAFQPVVLVGGVPVLLERVVPSAAGYAPATAEPFVAVDIVDNSNPQDPKDVDKLDPDALKQNVEKHFAK